MNLSKLWISIIMPLSLLTKVKFCICFLYFGKVIISGNVPLLVSFSYFFTNAYILPLNEFYFFLAAKKAKTAAHTWIPSTMLLTHPSLLKYSPFSPVNGVHSLNVCLSCFLQTGLWRYTIYDSSYQLARKVWS